MFLENKKIITVWYIAALFMIAIGVIAGTVYYVNKFIETAEIKNYLDGYTDSLRNGMDTISVIRTSLKSNAVLFSVIACTSFFKNGPYISAFLLIRKGFISAFTTAAMVDVYGLRGLALASGSFVGIVVFIPMLAVFAAIAVFVSRNRCSFEKRDKIIYIIFLLIIFTIFCGCAFLEGILTTTFMKWLAFKVT